MDCTFDRKGSRPSHLRETRRPFPYRSRDISRRDLGGRDKSRLVRALGLEREVISMPCPILLAGACQDRFECGDYRSVELALNSLRDTKPCNSTQHSVAIWPIRRHGVVSVRDRDDLGKQWDLFPTQSVGIAKPVHALMVMANNLRNLGVVLDVGENPLADSRVILH